MTPAGPGMSADEELTAALTHYTAERLGNLLLLLFESVSRTHPDMLREAIGRAFDLSLYEEEARKARARLGRLRDELLALRQQLADLRREVEDAAHQPRVETKT